MREPKTSKIVHNRNHTMECDLQYDLVNLFYHTAELLKINVT